MTNLWVGKRSVMKINVRSGGAYRRVHICRPRLPGDELFEKPAQDGMFWRVISREEAEAEKALERRRAAAEERRLAVWWRVVLRRLRIW